MSALQKVRVYCIALVAVGGLSGKRGYGQTADQLRQVHDGATALIRQMANRPLTPGDTLLTWSPDPGGLIHTVAVDSAGVRSSLLRADGMIGTADVRCTRDQPTRFDVQWTTRDSLTGRAIPARDVHGVVDGGMLRISGSKPDSLGMPAGPWAVVDFGMEGQLIPLVRTLPANAICCSRLRNDIDHRRLRRRNRLRSKRTRLSLLAAAAYGRGQTENPERVKSRPN